MRLRCEGCGDCLGSVEPAINVTFSRETGQIAKKM
jgi:hypothetical protein